MTESTPPEIERLLQSGANASELMPGVYAELRSMAAHLMLGEKVHHTLQPTALVHETFLRLAGSRKVGEKGRLEFLDAAAVAMRRILVDHARRRNASKRGGGWDRVTLQDVELGEDGVTKDIDLAALDTLLTELAQLDPRQARIVELRFFGGLTGQEIADHLGISRPTVVRELTMARAWLRRGLEKS